MKAPHFLTSSLPIASIQLSRNLPEGITRQVFPAAFHACEEIFVLVDDSKSDRTDVNLWIIRPSQGLVDVVPQPWFGNGKFDFGYQWITRVTREHTQGNLVGDGIRIGAFLLDSTGKIFIRRLQPTINA
jgi:hypothetical protein